MPSHVRQFFGFLHLSALVFHSPVAIRLQMTALTPAARRGTHVVQRPAQGITVAEAAQCVADQGSAVLQKNVAGVSAAQRTRSASIQTRAYAVQRMMAPCAETRVVPLVSSARMQIRNSAARRAPSYAEGPAVLPTNSVSTIASAVVRGALIAATIAVRRVFHALMASAAHRPVIACAEGPAAGRCSRAATTSVVARMTFASTIICVARGTRYVGTSVVRLGKDVRTLPRKHARRAQQARLPACRSGRMASLFRFAVPQEQTVVPASAAPTKRGTSAPDRAARAARSIDECQL
jgi:hypothetical protein